jgi:two-component sensor histidine kinase
MTDELREMTEQLARELEDSKRLQEVSSLLVGKDSGDRLFEEIVDAAMTIMRSDFGSIQVADPEREELRLIAWRNFHPEAAMFWKIVSMKTGATCGSALHHGQRIIVPNVREADFLRDSESQHYWKLSGITAVQSTPLVTRDGRIVGMISTHWREVHHPTQRELRLLDIIARQAADFFDRKQAEEALRQREANQRLLVAELQHRVRNILAVTRSIIRRTLPGKTDVQDFVQHLEGRIDALARTQALLTRSPGMPVDLEEIVRDELLAQAAREPKYAVAGPRVCLHPQAAEVITLAVHELATNSVKYGALAEDRGKIRIGWDQDRDGEDHWLKLRWVESGVELNGTSRKAGFGTELITRRVPYELGGSGELIFNKTGLTAVIEFPLKQADSILQARAAPELESAR